MKKFSNILFAIWLFFLSMLPCGVIYNTRIIESDINEIATENICKAIGHGNPRKNNAVRIATYNLLADGVGYYGGRDFRRSSGVTDLLCNVSADVIGLQEVSRWWFRNIIDNTKYEFVDPLRTEIGGFMTAIAYDAESVMLLEYGNIALKKGSNIRLRRIVWGLFTCKSSDERFLVVNTHFNVMESDNSVGLIQAQQLTQVVRELNRKYDCPVFVTGDYNAKNRGAVSFCSSVVYDLLSLKMSDAHYIAHNRSVSKTNDHNRCLDHIFTVGEVNVNKWTILSQEPLKQLSDHYMIFVDII